MNARIAHRASRALAGALLVALTSSAQAADPKVESQVNKLQADAMDFDFLALELKKAKLKLQTALKKCGKDKCAKPLVASLHRDLGIVLINVGDTKAGEKELVAAVGADPSVTIGTDFLANAQVKKAWESARKKKGVPAQPAEAGASGAAGASVAPPAPAEGGLTVAATVAPVGVELPIVIDVPAALDVATVKVSYKTEAMEKYRPVEAKRSGAKWVVVLPCEATTKPTTIKYYARALDGAGGELERYGTLKKPAILKVVDKMPEDVEPPTLPGGQEPRSCDQVGSGKPGGSGCREDDECEKGLVCVANESGKKWCKPGDRATTTPSEPKLWIGVDGQLDFVFLGAERDLCKLDSWTCSVDLDGRKDVGVSSGVNVVSGGGGKTDGGMSVATKRVFLSLDYFVIPRLSVGARLGGAFGGNPTDASKFLPIHLEARIQYFITDGPFRPYFLLNGGFAELDAPVPNVIVTPLDPGLATSCKGGADPPCAPGDEQIKGVTAWKRAGPAFVGAGLGAWLVFDKIAINLGIGKMALAVPRVAFAWVPEVGMRYAF